MRALWRDRTVGATGTATFAGVWSHNAFAPRLIFTDTDVAQTAFDIFPRSVTVTSSAPKTPAGQRLSSIYPPVAILDDYAFNLSDPEAAHESSSIPDGRDKRGDSVLLQMIDFTWIAVRTRAALDVVRAAAALRQQMPGVLEVGNVS